MKGMHCWDEPGQHTAGGEIPSTLWTSTRHVVYPTPSFHRLMLGGTAWVPIPRRGLFPVRQLELGSGKLLLSCHLAGKAAGPPTYQQQHFGSNPSQSTAQQTT